MYILAQRDAHTSHCIHPSVKKPTRAAHALYLHHECRAVAHHPLSVKQPTGTCLLAFVCITGRRAIPKGSSIPHALLTKLPETRGSVSKGSSIAHEIEASGTYELKTMWTGPGMATERAAMERQKQKLRQACAGAPARHARFGGLFVRRYNAEDRGCVVRSNPLVSHLPALPEPKKANKTVVGNWSPDSCPALMLLSCICVFQCC